MILPSKHIPENRALLGLGAVLLRELHIPCTVSSLWEKIRVHQSVGTFERFILALDMLYVLGVIKADAGTIERIQL
jgi:hypothetical protein